MAEDNSCINCNGNMIVQSAKDGIVTYVCEDECGYTETRGFPKRAKRRKVTKDDLREKTIDEILGIDQTEEEEDE